jgi:hypothetical protein
MVDCQSIFNSLSLVLLACTSRSRDNRCRSFEVFGNDFIDELARRRGPGESFSDVIIRVRGATNRLC